MCPYEASVRDWIFAWQLILHWMDRSESWPVNLRPSCIGCCILGTSEDPRGSIRDLSVRVSSGDRGLHPEPEISSWISKHWEDCWEIWAENRRGCSRHFPLETKGYGSGHVSPAWPVRVLPYRWWMDGGRKLLKGWWRLEAPGCHFAHHLQKTTTEWRETKVKRGDEVLCLPRPSQLNGQQSPSSRGSFEMGSPYLPSRVLATTWIQTTCLLEDIFNLEGLELITSHL